MARNSTQNKNISRKVITNPQNKTEQPKSSTTNFLLNYSKSLEATKTSKEIFLTSLN